MPRRKGWMVSSVQAGPFGVALPRLTAQRIHLEFGFPLGSQGFCMGDMDEWMVRKHVGTKTARLLVIWQLFLFFLVCVCGLWCTYLSSLQFLARSIFQFGSGDKLLGILILHVSQVGEFESSMSDVDKMSQWLQLQMITEQSSSCRIWQDVLANLVVVPYTLGPFQFSGVLNVIH